MQNYCWENYDRGDYEIGVEVVVDGRMVVSLENLDHLWY